MGFLKSFLNKKKPNIDDVSIKYNAAKNVWLVVKDSKVLYMDDEASCKTYVEQMSMAN